MKIIFGADAISYPLTGIGRYAYEIAMGLARQDEIESLRYFVGSRFVEKLPEASAVRFGRTNALRAARDCLAKSDALMDLYRSVNARLQAHTLHGVTDAVYHSPSYYLPPYEGPCVATFHDLSVLINPEFHPSGRVRFMARELPVALRRARVLIAVSEFARNELIAYSGFPGDRVLCAPLAASSEFYPRDSSACMSALSKFGLSYRGYVLFAGTVEPRKNLSRLLDAYAMLPISLRRSCPLVVAGFRGWRSEDLHARLELAQAEGWARYLGFVDSADLPLLFAGGLLFTFPSIYEGFGLPVLEAMASGVPVVCSNATSLPEVAGGHALMCAPDDVEMLSHLLERGINDREWREAAIVGGLSHAKSFSWKKTVSQTLDAYFIALNN